jgi:hypothetical protein
MGLIKIDEKDRVMPSCDLYRRSVALHIFSKNKWNKNNHFIHQNV